MNRNAGRATADGHRSILSVSDLPEPRRFLIVALSVVVCLVALSSLGASLAAFSDSAAVRVFHRAFYLDQERNAAALTNFLFFIVNFGLSALIARSAVSRSARFRWHWLGLAALFLFLGFDEAASLH